MSEAITINNIVPNERVKKVNPYVVAITILLPAILSMVASSATNVCQPHIAGYFGATPYEANSVITAYIIASGVMLPIFGWLINLLGKKTVEYLSIGLFCIGTILCLIAKDLHMLIIARVIQGIGGGSLVPMSQAVLLETFPPEKKGVAMGFFGFSVMFSPLAGPFIGGFLTDNFSWQWVFLINIPICIVCAVLVKLFIEDDKKSEKQSKHIDAVGLAAIIIAMGAMQIVLDKGEQFNWFDTDWIYWMSALSVVSFVFFYIWELETKKPVVNVRVFKDRNFLLGTTISSFINIILYATLLLVPMFTQNILGYSPYYAGISVLPRAISCFIGLLIMGKVADMMDNRLLTAIGFIIMAISVFMFSNLNNASSLGSIMLPNLLLGIGISAAFVPISALSFITLPKSSVTDAAGLHALYKNIVTAVSTSAASTYITRVSQVHQNYLVGNLTPLKPVFYTKLALLHTKFAVHFNDFVAAKKASGFLYKQMLTQSKLLAFYDIFLLLAALCVLIIPMVLFFKLPKKNKKRKFKTVRALYRLARHNVFR